MYKKNQNNLGTLGIQCASFTTCKNERKKKRKIKKMRKGIEISYISYIVLLYFVSLFSLPSLVYICLGSELYLFLNKFSFLKSYLEIDISMKITGQIISFKSLFMQRKLRYFDDASSFLYLKLRKLMIFYTPFRVYIEFL